MQCTKDNGMLIGSNQISTNTEATSVHLSANTTQEFVCFFGSQGERDENLVASPRIQRKMGHAFATFWLVTTFKKLGGGKKRFLCTFLGAQDRLQKKKSCIYIPLKFWVIFPTPNYFINCKVCWASHTTYYYSIISVHCAKSYPWGALLIITIVLQTPPWKNIHLSQLLKNFAS